MSLTQICEEIAKEIEELGLEAPSKAETWETALSKVLTAIKHLKSVKEEQ